MPSSNAPSRMPSIVRRWMKLPIALAVMLTVSGCVTTPSADDFCLSSRLVRLTDATINQLSDAEAADLRAHNQLYLERCSK